jgi:hypothetical protein
MVERRGTKLHIDFLVDLPALNQDQAEKLLSFLQRYHNHRTTSPEVVQTAA